jgi:hypothetical protein
MVKVIRDIELSFIHPPIPDRNCDWQASRKGWDLGDPLGHGRTPIVALADLLEKEMDVEETPQ